MTGKTEFMSSIGWVGELMVPFRASCRRARNRGDGPLSQPRPYITVVHWDPSCTSIRWGMSTPSDRTMPVTRAVVVR